MRVTAILRFSAHPGRSWGLACSLAGLAVVASGCVQTVDVKTALQVTSVATGYFDDGIVNGKNKLVPSCTVQLKNVSDATVRSVQLNAVFRRLGEEQEEWGSAFSQAVSADGLEAGQTTLPVVMRSQLGYTGEQPRAEMLQHRLFVDAKVELFAKQGGAQWVKLGEYPIERKLLTQ